MTECDVAVVGAGPAGRALASRLAVRGARTVLIDPAPARPWRATYAAWTDELPDWLGAAARAVALDSVRVYGSRAAEVPRGYTVLDTPALQADLAHPDIVPIPARADHLAAQEVRLTDGRRIAAARVIDARGTTAGGPHQTAFGVVVSRDDAAPLLDGSAAILMDWRTVDDDRDVAPSFLYVVPLDAERVLVEETCLVGDPALTPGELRRRLRARVGDGPVGGAEILATERVSFGVDGIHARPWAATPLLFGARAGLMHPATGYSVAASLAAADDLAAAIARGDDPRQALWPINARLVHHLRSIGLRALLRMPGPAMADFFDAFFALPVEAQRTYLSDRADARGVAATMLRLFGDVDSPTRRRLARAII